MNEPPTASLSRLRRLLSVPIAIEAIVLAWFLLLLREALQEGFRGGRFIIATVLIGAALALVVLAREIMMVVWSDGAVVTKIESGAPPVDEESGQTPPWPTILASAGTIFGIFASILVLGTILGITFASWVILMLQSRLKFTPALIGALLIGVLLPVGFANLLDLNLWPGLLPEIIPNWIGGGMLPPI